ncbi:hypothetical protein FOMG_19585 [Fusarium oxysporum f. sp. melonis 26406]|uniref:Uncharacterized protein n=1 Tax=Fusarium oxysporum f. sp. melonis 26406 TaxID=1089452 RepID=W9Z5W3_FUSOX|nr:hypothetical protein FOMG_19585 [Fusarium oxysporum f. sp. melonis 26406]
MIHQGPKHQSTKSPTTQRMTLQSQVGRRAKSIICPMNGERRISGPHGDML